MADHRSEPDEMTLRTLAIIEDTTVAEQRRIALAAYARRAREEDPNVAEIVRLMLTSRRKRANGGGNVIRLDGRAGGG